MEDEKKEIKTQPFDIFKLEEEHQDVIDGIIENRDNKEDLPLPFLESSPFVVLGSKTDSNQRLIFENQYATVFIEGEILDVNDEDVFLALLTGKPKDPHEDKKIQSTSINDIMKKTGANWGGKKQNSNSLTKSEEIIQSLKKLKKSVIIMHRKKEKRTLMFNIVDYLDIPYTTEDGTLVTDFTKGNKNQIDYSLSDQFYYFYSEYKTYNMKLIDRKLIKNELGKAFFRYTIFLTTFRKSGVHRERLKLLIKRINWELPTQTKNDKVYTRWSVAKQQLERAKKGLERVGITLIIPDKLDYESIIEIRDLKKYQAEIELGQKE